MKRATLKDLQNVTYDELNRMNKAQLRNLVTNAGDAINKRLDRLEKSPAGRVSTAYRNWKEAGSKKFSAKDIKKGSQNERNLLLAEAARAKHFISAKTASAKGTNEVRRDTQKRIGYKFTNIEEEVAFWEGYRRYLERAKDLKLQSYGSDTDIKGYANYDEAEITALKDSFKDQYGEYHHPLTEDHEVISEEAAEEIARTMLINSAAQDIYTVGQHQRQLDNEFFAGPDLGGN